MRFHYSSHMQQTFPERVAGILTVAGIDASRDVTGIAVPFYARAEQRLGEQPESQFPEIQAWRRAFATMGLKPTQYRCASEALLRRYRKDGSLPTIHPLIDLCNAVSLAFAVPIAVFDRERITGDLVVRQADGSEVYETSGSDIEHPEKDEVIFADDAGRAHARRWANRQSKHSAVSPATRRAFIVAEALHDDAEADIRRLTEELGMAIAVSFATRPTTALLLTPSADFFSGDHESTDNVD